MGSNFELIARGLIDMGGTQYIEALDARGQGHRALYHCSGAFRSLNDLHRRLIYQPVVKRFQANTNFLALHSQTSG
jgi:hypothetical protein